MTKDNLVTAPVGTTLEAGTGDPAESTRSRSSRWLTTNGYPQGTYHHQGYRKDVYSTRTPPATQDGRLLCGAAIGITADVLDRAGALLKAQVDVLVLDSAHGHSKNIMTTPRQGQDRVPERCQSSRATLRPARPLRTLIEAGADAVKVGIGPGSICTTRIVAGIGVPQITAVYDCACAAAEVRHSGHRRRRYQVLRRYRQGSCGRR